MKKLVSIAATAFFLLCGFGLAVSASPGTVETQRYGWQGNINNNIPVTVWFEVRDGIIAGEITYTKTGANKPIRLLGQVGNSGWAMQEILPDGQVTGIITGKINGDVFEGHWMGPGTVKKKGSWHERVDGKTFPIRLTQISAPAKTVNWNCDPASLEGEYLYTYGIDNRKGVLSVSEAKGGSVEFNIDAHIGAPSFNLAQFPWGDPDIKNAHGALRGNRIVQEVDDTCAFEVLFFSDFAAVRYLDGKYCSGRFGAGASISGEFLKQSRHVAAKDPYTPPYDTMGNETPIGDIYANMANFDLSPIFVHPAALLGVIGDDGQRFYIHFTAAGQTPTDPYTYIVGGKTRVKNNICDFEGTVKILQAGLYQKGPKSVDFPNTPQGFIGAKVELEETGSASGLGKIRGVLQTYIKFGMQNGKNTVHYDDLMEGADGYYNFQFTGTWTSNKTGASKVCNFGHDRIPLAGLPEDLRLDKGTGMFLPEDAVITKGWQSYAGCYAAWQAKDDARPPEEAKQAACREEQRAWWKRGL